MQRSDVLSLFASSRGLVVDKENARNVSDEEIVAALPVHNWVHFLICHGSKQIVAQIWWHLCTLASWAIVAQLLSRLWAINSRREGFFDVGGPGPALVMLTTWSFFFASARTLYTFAYRPLDFVEVLRGLVQTDGHLRVLRKHSMRIALTNILFWLACAVSTTLLLGYELCSFLVEAVFPLEQPWARILLMLGYYYVWFPAFFYGGLPYALTQLVDAHSAEVELVIYRKHTFDIRQVVATFMHHVDTVSPALDFPYVNDTHTWIFNSCGLGNSLFSAWFAFNSDLKWTVVVSSAYVIAGFTIVLLSWVPYSSTAAVHMSLTRAALHLSAGASRKGWTHEQVMYLERIIGLHPPIFAVGPFEVTAPFVWTYSNVVLFLLVLIIDLLPQVGE